MNDDQFDDLARSALAHDAGPPNDAAWNRVKPIPWAWLPTSGEILACAGACGILLLILATRQISSPEPNRLVENAERVPSPSLLASVTRVDGARRVSNWEVVAPTD